MVVIMGLVPTKLFFSGWGLDNHFELEAQTSGSRCPPIFLAQPQTSDYDHHFGVVFWRLRNCLGIKNCSSFVLFFHLCRSLTSVDQVELAITYSTSL